MTSRPRIVALLGAFLLAAGCAPHHATPVQPWRSEARTTPGVVRVLPVLVRHDPLPDAMEDYVGAGLPWIREWLREERQADVERIPEALGEELPAALKATLGARWDGLFVQGSFRGDRRAVRRALGTPGLDDALSGLRATDPVLVVWVTGLRSHPLTADGFPGEILHTTAGPVVLDHVEEPFLVEAEVGLALVAVDGEVVVRTTESVTTVLSARRTASEAAAEIARSLAGSAVALWTLDEIRGERVVRDR